MRYACARSSLHASEPREASATRSRGAWKLTPRQTPRCQTGRQWPPQKWDRHGTYPPARPETANGPGRQLTRTIPGWRRERTGGTPTTARLTPRPGAALSFTARRNCHAGGTPIAVTATRNSSSFSSPSPSGREREGGCESECVSDSTGGEASPPSRKLNTDVSTDTWASSRPDVEERGVGGGNTGGAAFTGALA